MCPLSSGAATVNLELYSSKNFVCTCQTYKFLKRAYNSLLLFLVDKQFSLIPDVSLTIHHVTVSLFVSQQVGENVRNEHVFGSSTHLLDKRQEAFLSTVLMTSLMQIDCAKKNK